MPENKNMEKAIIEAIQAKKQDYFGSAAFAAFKEQGDAVSMAIEQKYRAYEQTTRSGFYLATMSSMYEALIESFTQVYSDPKPLFIFDSKRMGGEDMALLAQRFLNRVWDNMGQDNSGGLSQWLSLCLDVPMYNMAVAHPCWKRIGGMVEKPYVDKGAWAPTIEWRQEFDILLNEPALERVHPYNWFGYHTKSDELPFEGFLSQWDLGNIQAFMKDNSYNRENLSILAKEMQKDNADSDSYFYEPGDKKNKARKKDKTDITVYYGRLNDVKGLENDAHEYLVVHDSKRIYKVAVNNIPGFRQTVRVRSQAINDLPFGRSIMAPSLSHAKIMNLYANLGIDDTVMRIHNGWAVWDNYLQNPNEFENPEGTNGIVRMRQDAPVEKLPKRIGGERSGVLDDMLNMYHLIKRDSEATGLSDQAKGLKSLKQETATGQMLDKQADDRRARSAIITMARTGLHPCAKQILMMALRNTPEIERHNLSYDGEIFSVDNEQMAQIWNNSFFQVSDAIEKDQETEATKLVNFLGVAREVLMEDPRGLSYLNNMLRDVGRKSGLSNIEKYFPEDQPVQIPQQPQAQPPAGQPLSGVSPLPAQAAEPQIQPGVSA